MAVGERLAKLLIEHGDRVKADATLYAQVKGFIRAYLDAAGTSRNDRMVDAALGVASAFREIGVPSAS